MILGSKRFVAMQAVRLWSKCKARSCASGAGGTTEAFNIEINGTFEGSDINAVVSSAPIFKEEAILGKPFCGKRLLRGYSWFGCGSLLDHCHFSI